MAFELLPFEKIKNYLDLEGSNYADYPALEQIAARLVPSFEAETGRLFEKIERTVKIYVGNCPRRMLRLDALPVASVEQVQVDDSDTGLIDLGSANWRVTDYGVNLYTHISNAVVEITYTGGLVDTVPVLEAAALYQMAYEFQSKDQIGASNVSNEGGTVTRPEIGLLKETRRILAGEWHPLKV